MLDSGGDDAPMVALPGRRDAVVNWRQRVNKGDRPSLGGSLAYQVDLVPSIDAWWKHERSTAARGPHEPNYNRWLQISATHRRKVYV